MPVLVCVLTDTLDWLERPTDLYLPFYYMSSLAADRGESREGGGVAVDDSRNGERKRGRECQRNYQDRDKKCRSDGEKAGMGSEIVGGVWADRRTEWQHLQARSASTRFYCKICNIACSGQQHYESHVGGKKHRRRVKQKQLEDAKSDPSLKRPEVVKTHKKFKEPPPYRAHQLKLVKCSNGQDWATSLEIYGEMQGLSIEPHISMYHIWLSLCCDEAVLVEDDAEKRAAVVEKGLLISSDFTAACGESLQDGSFALLIRLYSIAGNIQLAKEYLRRTEAGHAPSGKPTKQKSKIKKKARLYGPILQYHPCTSVADITALMETFQRGLALGIEFEEPHFLHIVKACSVARGALQPGDDASVGMLKRAVDKVLLEMQQVVFTVAAESRAVLSLWFDDAKAVAVDKDGLSAACGLRMTSIDLTAGERATTLTSINEIIGRGGACKQGAEKKVNSVEQFNRFKAFLEGRPAPDVIIDGANVGYFMQRVDLNRHLPIKCSQIDRVVSHFAANGKNVLLILHERHFYWKRLKQSKEAGLYLKKWKGLGILYQTPTHMNDDWFWLYACLWSSHNGKQPFVITNDLMRDHHFKMLSHKCFLKWRERHVVNFMFPGRSEGAQPTFIFPQPFSIRIQRHVFERKAEGVSVTHWHFPTVTTKMLEAETPNKATPRLGDTLGQLESTTQWYWARDVVKL